MRLSALGQGACGNEVSVLESPDRAGPAATIIGLTMAAGIRRGLDHAVTVAAGDHTTIAISLSDSIYHINLGYLGLKQVADTIYEYWRRDSHGAEPDVTVPSAEWLNAGIRAASSLGPQTSGYVSDGSLIVSQNDGKGALNYVTIAFQLFGTQVQSLFYLYFAPVGLSALIFILTFRDNIYALAVLLCTLAGYYIQLHLHIFDPAAVPIYSASGMDRPCAWSPCGSSFSSCSWRENGRPGWCWVPWSSSPS
jgi:hypothetical protein